MVQLLKEQQENIEDDKKAIGLLGTRELTDCFSAICLSYIQEQ